MGHLPTRPRLHIHVIIMHSRCMARDPNHQVRKQYEQSLGIELGGIFAELWQEVVWLQIVWSEYRVVFGTSPEQLESANESAAGFFFVVENVTREWVFLNLARLTDPPATKVGKAPKQNLTIAALAGLVKPSLMQQIGDLTQAAIDATSFARDWRNRYIAHKDLPLALGHEGAKPLMPASRAAVEVALAAIREVLNAIDWEYNRATTRFDFVDHPNGAKRLLDLLAKGGAAEKAERKARQRHHRVD